MMWLVSHSVCTIAWIMRPKSQYNVQCEIVHDSSTNFFSIVHQNSNTPILHRSCCHRLRCSSGSPTLSAATLSPPMLPSPAPWISGAPNCMGDNLVEASAPRIFSRNLSCWVREMTRQRSVHTTQNVRIVYSSALMKSMFRWSEWPRNEAKRSSQPKFVGRWNTRPCRRSNLSWHLHAMKFKAIYEQSCLSYVMLVTPLTNFPNQTTWTLNLPLGNSSWDHKCTGFDSVANDIVGLEISSPLRISSESSHER